MRKKIFLCLFFSTCLFAFVHGQTDSENNLKFDEEKDTVIHLEEHVVVGRHIRKTSLLKLPVALSEMPLTMSVVEGRVLSDLNITDLLNINKTTTGIRVMNNYGGFHMFRTRGLNGVVLLSNGIRDERSEFYSCAPTSSFVGVNRIEVLTESVRMYDTRPTVPCPLISILLSAPVLYVQASMCFFCLLPHI